MGFYKTAATSLESILLGRGSPKSIILGNDRIRVNDKKRLYAAVCESMKYSGIILKILDESEILKKEKTLKDYECIVILHDLLFARGGIQHTNQDSKLKKQILAHKKRIIQIYEAHKKATGNVKKDMFIPKQLVNKEYIPRYVRVNLNKTSVEKIVQEFEASGYKHIGNVKLEKLQEMLGKNKNKKIFCQDPHLHDLLIFPEGTNLIEHGLYKEGKIILQDKASCFPASILYPEKDGQVIDGCAAPGNKTSHLSSLMGNSGKIFAIDKDAKRLKVLQNMTHKAGCKNITTKNMSFLDIDPQSAEFNNVEYILLDPSCSGSGIVNREDKLVEYFIDIYCARSNSKNMSKRKTSDDRQEKLAEFQTTVLLHAMKFEKVKKITYSTCSIHETENENVVRNVLNGQKRFVLDKRENVLPTWSMRGHEFCGLSTDQSASLIRSDPSMFTNGFFVACFVLSDPSFIVKTAEPTKECSSETPNTPNTPNTPVKSKDNQLLVSRSGTSNKRKAVEISRDTTTDNRNNSGEKPNQNKKHKKAKRRAGTPLTSR